MGHRAPLLIEAAPKFSTKGGLFFVDFEIEGMPVIALSPNVMLKAIAKAGDAYADWSQEAGAAIRKHGR